MQLSRKKKSLLIGNPNPMFKHALQIAKRSASISKAYEDLELRSKKGILFCYCPMEDYKAIVRKSFKRKSMSSLI